MGWNTTQPTAPLTALEAFQTLTLEDLRPLSELIASDPPKKKSDLVPWLAKVMTDPAKVQELYDGLDESSRRAVRIAAFDPAGRLDLEKLQAQFGEKPRFNTADPNRSKWDYDYKERKQIKPTLLRLFFPRFKELPRDVRAILRSFAPAPKRFSIPTLDAPPLTHTLPKVGWTNDDKDQQESQEPVRVRETATEAQADLLAVLRLVEAGKVRVTDKNFVPTEASRKALAPILAGGDFYRPEEAEEWKYDPAVDLGIRSFAWPMLLQAGGLAQKVGDKLKLTAAGKKALLDPPAEVLDKLWASWLKTKTFDEFSRVDAIKGQSRAHMSGTAGRREVVVQALGECPVGEWFSIDDFFRLLRATGRSFEVAQKVYELYIAEHYYGNLGYGDEHAWEQLQGRFILVFLFEYAATLGVVDVAYLPPQGIRDDFASRWGADDLSCLSRYDGLLYVRINSLGAWLLGKAEEYRPAAPKRTDLIRVLPNRDVVAARELPAADRLLLERFAEPTSENVWALSASKALDAVEEGGSIDELEQFLTTRSNGDLPALVVQFLVDLRSKVDRLKNAGTARLIACADENVAAELAAERSLKGKCLRAGDRFVVVRDADLAAVKKAVKRLGWVWPILDE
ncbi:hypothetical protein [Paludisphaera rhizosphaerae]|uniref:hypothetical protein n=1 Tax=Paludisphaera rhizosphaerae TaxID=2711216 RepID=UPI0013EC8DAA|nr:hypothetical protein [Paludisphaera rhizosphaerae]